jgi:hypothetical protein
MRPGLIAVLAATALVGPLATGCAAQASPPRPAAQASTPQPDGAGSGWTLVSNDSGSDIYDTWSIDPPFTGADCTTPGKVSLDSHGDVELESNGSDDDCAEVSSPPIVSPTSTREVFIEYRADLPTDSWNALWATGDPGPNPTTGEIDTAEMLGDSNQCTTFHFGPVGAGDHLGSACRSYRSATWATYGVAWMPGTLTFYVNGTKWLSWSSSDITGAPEQIVMDNLTAGWDKYGVLQCSEGGSPGKPPLAAGCYPPATTMLVSYVRVWSRAH